MDLAPEDVRLREVLWRLGILSCSQIGIGAMDQFRYLSLYWWMVPGDVAASRVVL